jgi:hypothetical protein
VEYNKGKLTLFEAQRNFWEMIDTMDLSHAKKLAKFLHDEEEKERKPNS